jgi:hypothetical protein
MKERMKDERHYVFPVIDGTHILMGVKRQGNFRGSPSPFGGKRSGFKHEAEPVDRTLFRESWEESHHKLFLKNTDQKTQTYVKHDTNKSSYFYTLNQAESNRTEAYAAEADLSTQQQEVFEGFEIPPFPTSNKAKNAMAETTGEIFQFDTTPLKEVAITPDTVLAELQKQSRQQNLRNSHCPDWRKFPALQGLTEATKAMYPENTISASAKSKDAPNLKKQHEGEEAEFSRPKKKQNNRQDLQSPKQRKEKEKGKEFNHPPKRPYHQQDFHSPKQHREGGFKHFSERQNSQQHISPVKSYRTKEAEPSFTRQQTSQNDFRPTQKTKRGEDNFAPIKRVKQEDTRPRNNTVGPLQPPASTPFFPVISKPTEPKISYTSNRSRFSSSYDEPAEREAPVRKPSWMQGGIANQHHHHKKEEQESRYESRSPK